jgi:hypothetical protein
MVGLATASIAPRSGRAMWLDLMHTWHEPDATFP